MHKLKKLSIFVFFLFLSTGISHAKDKKIYTSDGERFAVEEVFKVDGVIWGFDFLPDNKIIFTERSGKLKTFDPVRKGIFQIQNTPAVWAQGQGGMLDVRVHPKNSKIYLTYSEPLKKGATTALGMADLENNVLKNFKQIFSAVEGNNNEIHFGSRIEFDLKGHVFMTVGDRNDRPKVQSLEYHLGKIVRLKEDGSIPEDNPFVKTPKAKPEIYALGIRSPQGLVFHPTSGELWEVEMGPRGGDEVNIIRAGKNYGWPIVTYGKEYWGPKIGEGTEKPGIEKPVVYWVPSISPSGATFYTGNIFPKWKNQMFIGTLSGQHLRRLKVQDDKIVDQEILLAELGLRIRNVRTGPDGYLYFSTDRGKLNRLVPIK